MMQTSRWMSQFSENCRADFYQSCSHSSSLLTCISLLLLSHLNIFLCPFDLQISYHIWACKSCLRRGKINVVYCVLLLKVLLLFSSFLKIPELRLSCTISVQKLYDIWEKLSPSVQSWVWRSSGLGGYWGRPLAKLVCCRARKSERMDFNWVSKALRTTLSCHHSLLRFSAPCRLFWRPAKKNPYIEKLFSFPRCFLDISHLPLSVFISIRTFTKSICLSPSRSSEMSKRRRGGIGWSHTGRRWQQVWGACSPTSRQWVFSSSFSLWSLPCYFSILSSSKLIFIQYPLESLKVRQQTGGQHQ